MKLTRKEFDMLQLLAGNPGRVFTYEQIFGQVWNEEYIGSVNTISKHISRLRGKAPGLEIAAFFSFDTNLHILPYSINIISPSVSRTQIKTSMAFFIL